VNRPANTLFYVDYKTGNLSGSSAPQDFRITYGGVDYTPADAITNGIVHPLFLVGSSAASTGNIGNYTNFFALGNMTLSYNNANIVFLSLVQIMNIKFRIGNSAIGSGDYIALSYDPTVSSIGQLLTKDVA
jgi:hypothetical protein